MSALAITLLLAGTSPAGAAGGDPAALCEAAARRAAERHGVPADLLAAIALAESARAVGGRLRPWPWTVNAGGTGHWFETREAAEAFLAAETAAGRRDLDIGCFQINLRWHGNAFASPAAMLDPEAGGAHAARFLARLAAETGDWGAAAGAYHSRTPDLAARYRGRVEAIRARLAAAAAEAGPAGPPASRSAVDLAPPRRPSGPKSPSRAPVRGLLVGGAAGAPGSLVPARARGPALLVRAAPLLAPRPSPRG